MDAPALLKAFGDRLAQGDAAGCALLFTPDATYEEPPQPLLVGRDAIRAFVAGFAATHRDVTFTVGRICLDATAMCVAAEWRFTYTRVADGTRGGFEGMSMIEVRGGQIARWRGFSARLAL